MPDEFREESTRSSGQAKACTQNRRAAAGLRPCVFFDRDGVVNQSPGPGYVERVEDFSVLPEFIAALRVTRARGHLAVVVTNQRGIATGVMAAGAVEAIHQALRARLAREGLSLDAIEVCPHDRGMCDCRKPKPGLLERAARALGIDMAASWMVGDHETDVEAGHRAGCRAIRVGGDEPESRAEFRLSGMEELAEFLRSHLPDASRERNAT